MAPAPCSSYQKQQKFSEYSENNPNPVSDDENFSEYQEDNQMSFHNMHQTITKNIINKKYPKKRVYSYNKQQINESEQSDLNKLNQKGAQLNYLNKYDRLNAQIYNSLLIPLPPPMPLTINRTCLNSKYLAGSPCGIEDYNGYLNLAQYDKYYLNGMNKYFKASNSNNSYNSTSNHSKLLSKNRSLSISSRHKNQFYDINHDNQVQRSQYWNGSKYDYFNKQVINPKIVHNTQQQNQRTYKHTGIKINKKQNKFQDKERNKNNNMKGMIDTSNYIKIEEQPSSKKNMRAKKMDFKKGLSMNLQIDKENYQKNTSNQRQNDSISRNSPDRRSIPHQNNQNQQNLNRISTKQVKPNHSNNHHTFEQQSIAYLLLKIDQLQKQNNHYLALLREKDIQINHLSKQRIIDNQDYADKIQKLKGLFWIEREDIVHNYEKQLQIYKEININMKNDIINKQNVKDQQQTLMLALQNKKLERYIKEINEKNKHLQANLQQKSQGIQKLMKQITNINGTVKQLKQKSAKTQLPKWISSFLRVFQDMIRKLPIEIDETWNSKKVVIVGWRVLKKVIEKAVKLGIKMPNLIPNEQDPDISLSDNNKHRSKNKTEKLRH